MGWVKQVNLAILWHHDKHDKRMTYQWISSYVMSCLLPAWLAGILLFLPTCWSWWNPTCLTFRLTKVCWAPCLEMPKSWVKILGPGNIGIWGHSNGAAYLIGVSYGINQSLELYLLDLTRIYWNASADALRSPILPILSHHGRARLFAGGPGSGLRSVRCWKKKFGVVLKIVDEFGGIVSRGPKCPVNIY